MSTIDDILVPARALFVQWRSRGHVQAALGVAEKLRCLGSSVCFIGPEALRGTITKEGHQFESHPLFDIYRFPIGVGRRPLDLASLLRSPSLLMNAVRNYRQEGGRLISSIPFIVSELQQLCGRLSPDLIIFDPFLAYYYIPLYNLGIPCVVLSSKSHLTPFGKSPPYTVDLIPNTGVASELIVGASWCLAALQYRAWSIWEAVMFGLTPYRLSFLLSCHCSFNLTKRWHLRHHVTDVRFSGLKEWILSAPEFDFPTSPSELGESFYIGPLVSGFPSEVSAPSGNNGHVLVTLTTVYRPATAAARRRRNFLNALLRAAGKFPSQVFKVAIGRGVEYRPDCPVPPNVELVDWIETRAELAGCRLMICSAGNNTVRECLHAGVPLLVFPDAADQPGAAARLAFHGLSLSMPLRRASAHDVERLIRQSLLRPASDVNWAKEVAIRYNRNGDSLKSALAQLRHDSFKAINDG